MIENIDSFLQEKGYKDETIVGIKNIRNSEPARRVRSNGKNVPGTYPSKKMGMSIQFESHTLELAGILEKEFDSNVLEYYDQPPSFIINYEINGKNRGHRYTPDFFVISEKWIGWEEWKKEEDLINLSIKSPTRYHLDEEGNWRCPPAEIYAEKYGLSFKIRTSKDLNWTYIRNVKFLEDYLKDEHLNINKTIKNNIYQIVAKKPGITIREFLELENVNIQADDLYSSFILGNIYIDIHHEVIPDCTAKLFCSKEYKDAYSNLIVSSSDRGNVINVGFKITAGEKILWDQIPWTIVNVGSTTISLLSDEMKTVDIPVATFEYLLKQGKVKGVSKSKLDDQKELELIRNASPMELSKANQKYYAILPFLNGNKVLADYANELNVTSRTIQNWISKYRMAERKYGNGFVGLLSEERKKGNRTKRFDENIQVLMETYIKENYEDLRQNRMKSVFLLFKQECINKGYTPPSYCTFTKYVKKTPKYNRDVKRKGIKAAYSGGEFYYELNENTPRHGDRIFEICHLDHTELDIELRCSLTGKNLGRPWLSLLVDAYSRRILALYVSFDPPSYRSCMMVLRECVKRHSRFPSTIVVDGGKDFNSIYFETLLTWNKCTKKSRPGSKPRFGNVIERLFGTTNEMFIYNLTGNTQLMKNVREVSKEVNPKKLSIWNLEKFVEVIKKWAHEIYDQVEHSSLGVSPKEMFEHSIAIGGARETTRIVYDKVFEMLTLPTTKKGEAKIIPGYGVKINRIYYWNNLFRNGLLENEKVPVRYDPFNMGIAYAFVNKRWIQLESEKYQIFKNRSEKEVNLAFEEIKRRLSLGQKKQEITTKNLAEFLRSIEAEEILLKQRLRDKAMRNLYVISGGKSNEYETKQQINPTKIENISLVIDNDKSEFDILDLEYEEYEEL